MKLVSIYEYGVATAVLYWLLQEREKDQSISHREMPSFMDHVRFVHSHPYEAWYFVMVDGTIVGACYLTRNDEIGIAIFKSERGRGYGSKAVRLLMEKHGPRRFLANINPRNERSAELFKSLGFRLIQHTYEADG